MRRSTKPPANPLDNAVTMLLDARRTGKPDPLGLNEITEGLIRREASRYARAVALLDAAGTQITLATTP